MAACTSTTSSTTRLGPSGGSMYTRKGTQYGKPQGVVRDDQPLTREGQAGRSEVAERARCTVEDG